LIKAECIYQEVAGFSILLAQHCVGQVIKQGALLFRRRTGFGLENIGGKAPGPCLSGFSHSIIWSGNE